MKRDFLEFLIQKETPPTVLHMEAKKDVMLSFRKTEILLKFLAYSILGALLSLSVCPQFGMGLVEGHGISHMFRMMGDWACAAFCGSLFLGSGMMMAFIGMRGEELWWVWRRYKFSLVILPALFWGALMLTNMKPNFASEAPSYHLVWMFTAVATVSFFLQMRSRVFLRQLAK